MVSFFQHDLYSLGFRVYLLNSYKHRALFKISCFFSLSDTNSKQQSAQCQCSNLAVTTPLSPICRNDVE